MNSGADTKLLVIRGRMLRDLRRELTRFVPVCAEDEPSGGPEELGEERLSGCFADGVATEESMLNGLDDWNVYQRLLKIIRHGERVYARDGNG